MPEGPAELPSAPRLTSPLRTRLTWIVAAALVLPTLAVGGYATWRMSQLLRENAQADHLLNLRARVEAARERLAHPADDLLHLSRQPEMIRLLAARDEQATRDSLDEVRSLLRSHIERWSTLYSHAAVLDAAGVELAHGVRGGPLPAGSPGEGGHAAGDAARLRLLADRVASLSGIPGSGSVAIGPVHTAGTARSVPFLLPLTNTRGHLGGALMLELDLASVLEALRSPSEGGRTWVYDDLGQPLLVPPGAQAVPLRQARPAEAARLLGSEYGVLPGGGARADAVEVFARIRPRGQAAIQWTVIDEVPLPALQGGVRQTAWAVVVSAAGLLVLGLVGTALLSRLVVRPMNALADAARGVAAERFDLPVQGTERGDEIGVLARSFVGMRERLRSLIASLNERVRQLERAQDEIARREQRIRTLFESNIAGVCVVDAGTGQLRLANDAFLRIAGCTREDMQAGRVQWAALAAHTAPAAHDAPAPGRPWADIARELHAGGSLAAFEQELRRRDGSDSVPVLVAASRVAGSPDEAVLFVLDVSERRRAETEHRLRVEAESASRAKTTFLAGMSHELRTPLNAIMGFAQLLRMDPALGEAQRRMVGTILNAGAQQLALVSDLLDLARIEAGGVTLQPQPLLLPMLCDEAAELLRAAAADKGVALRLQVDERLPGPCLADRTRLTQVLGNLLGNAVKFTDRGSITLVVGSPTEAGAQAAAAGHVRVRFEVIDTGIGIDAADQERVFASFQQAGSAERRARGVGLGLAIARQLVRLMGGELRLQSKIGLGSRFHFELELPLAAGAQPAGEAGGGGPLLARSVLIVDDIAINIELLRQALAPHVQRCAEATSGEAALALAAEQAFDLILVDVRMPGLDGHETVRRLRRLPLQAAARIVCVSADAFDTSREEALAAGADAYVVKPVDIGKLLQAARRPARGAAHI